MSFFLVVTLLRKNTTNFALIVKDFPFPFPFPFLFLFTFLFLFSFVDMEISFSSVCPHFALFSQTPWTTLPTSMI